MKIFRPGTAACFSAAMIAAIAGQSLASNVNTTIQEGRVNINHTIQCGTSNDNATYQSGEVNINRTVQICRSRMNQLDRPGVVEHGSAARGGSADRSGGRQKYGKQRGYKRQSVRHDDADSSDD